MPEKFEEIFTKFDKGSKGGLTKDEIWEFTQANRNVNDPMVRKKTLWGGPPRWLLGGCDQHSTGGGWVWRGGGITGVPRRRGGALSWVNLYVVPHHISFPVQGWIAGAPMMLGALGGAPNFLLPENAGAPGRASALAPHLPVPPDPPPPAEKLEWYVTFLLAAKDTPQGRVITKDDMRGALDGTLFFRVAAAREAGRIERQGVAKAAFRPAAKAGAEGPRAARKEE